MRCPWRGSQLHMSGPCSPSWPDRYDLTREETRGAGRLNACNVVPQSAAASSPSGSPSSAPAPAPQAGGPAAGVSAAALFVAAGAASLLLA